VKEDQIRGFSNKPTCKLYEGRSIFKYNAIIMENIVLLTFSLFVLRILSHELYHQWCWCESFPYDSNETTGILSLVGNHSLLSQCDKFPKLDFVSFLIQTYFMVRKIHSVVMVVLKYKRMRLNKYYWNYKYGNILSLWQMLRWYELSLPSTAGLLINWSMAFLEEVLVTFTQCNIQ
jgi:hypothetical protein